ncbi:hypothetical protein CIPAW_16G037900 [Carya illinoinensis]|uniref:Uncharacterized protein n=1 Tax=Carya illinoinensis TaxID=32201 RepID=A0A8T1N3S4_CARIL|nr:hypothetical protein CIPAW_16G037900 [Carya illinoinensis]
MGVPQFIMTGFIGLLMVLILARKEDKYKAVTFMLMPTIMMFLGQSDLAELLSHRQGYALNFAFGTPSPQTHPSFRACPYVIYAYIYIYK